MIKIIDCDGIDDESEKCRSYLNQNNHYNHDVKVVLFSLYSTNLIFEIELKNQVIKQFYQCMNGKYTQY